MLLHMMTTSVPSGPATPTHQHSTQEPALPGELPNSQQPLTLALHTSFLGPNHQFTLLTSPAPLGTGTVMVFNFPCLKWYEAYKIIIYLIIISWMNSSLGLATGHQFLSVWQGWGIKETMVWESGGLAVHVCSTQLCSHGQDIQLLSVIFLITKVTSCCSTSQGKKRINNNKMSSSSWIVLWRGKTCTLKHYYLN